MEKIVVITGANSGIGKAAAIRFAREGYTVVMACRNLEKSFKIKEEIIQKTNNSKVDLLELDVSSMKSIQTFCEVFKSKYDKLDVLINNAGYFNHGAKQYQFSVDQIELTFATNTVGPFLLTHLLIDHLQKSDDPRVLNACTTNIRHFFEPKRKIDFDQLLGEYKESKKYNSYKMYGDSKMALLMLTFKMADVYKDINMNAIQIPAIKISKETIKQFKSIWRLAAKVQNRFSASQESMADTYYTICTSRDFFGVSGKLINDKREVMKSSHYQDGLIQDIKQFKDKQVYPKYADKVEHIEKTWEFCTRVTSQYL